MNGGQIDGKPALSAKLIERLSTPTRQCRGQVDGASHGYGLMMRDYRGVPFWPNMEGRQPVSPAILSWLRRSAWL